MWSAGQRQLSSDQLDTDANNAKKDLKLVSTISQAEARGVIE